LKKYLMLALTTLALLFTANGETKDLGLGVMVGGPTGVSGNYFLATDRSVDFGFGVGLGSRNLHLHSTVLASLCRRDHGG
jgi:hypothetical protein